MSPIEPLKTNNINPFRQFKSYDSYKTKKKKISDYFTFKNIALTTIAVGAAALCAYGIITKAKNKNILKTEDNTPDEIKNSPTIIATKEKFKEIISDLVHDDYDSTKTFRANFHIHSTASDGALDPLEILNQANNYARKLPANEKFSFAVVDHDNIDGVKKICNEINANPEKYKRINFVPGIEISSVYRNYEMASNPVELDFLIYGFNPQNQKLVNEIERRQNYLIGRTEALFNDINQAYPSANLSFEKMKKETSSAILKNVCSNGYLRALSEYISDTLKKSNVEYDENIITQATISRFNHLKISMDGNIDILNAVQLTKDIGGFSSLAHPGRFNFNYAGLKTEGLVFSDDIISKYINAGGDGLESHYMSLLLKRLMSGAARLWMAITVMLVPL